MLPTTRLKLQLRTLSRARKLPNILLQADRKSNVYIACIRHVNKISTSARKHSGFKSKSKPSRQYHQANDNYKGKFRLRPGSWNSRPLRILRFAALFARRRYKSTTAARGAVRMRTGQRHYALLRTSEIRASTKEKLRFNLHCHSRRPRRQDSV